MFENKGHKDNIKGRRECTICNECSIAKSNGELSVIGIKLNFIISQIIEAFFDTVYIL